MPDPKPESVTERWERPSGPRPRSENADRASRSGNRRGGVEQNGRYYDTGVVQHGALGGRHRPNESQRDRDRWLDDGGQSGYRDSDNHPQSRSSQFSGERHFATKETGNERNSPVAQEYGGGQLFAPPYSSFEEANPAHNRTTDGLTPPQGYRGYGPQRYTRTDDRILDEVHEQLTADHQVDARNIEVQVSTGTVTLTGRVVDKMMKYRAEEIAEGISGVKNVDNRIKIIRT